MRRGLITELQHVSPIIFEDVRDSGLCCICSQCGALGRCPRGGALMRYGCSQPTLQGRPQLCLVCQQEDEGSDGRLPTAYPREMEVGLPGEGEASGSTCPGGVEAGAIADALRWSRIPGGGRSSSERLSGRGRVV